MIHTIFFDIGDTLICSDNIFDWLGDMMRAKKQVSEFMEKRFTEITKSLENEKFLKVSEILSMVLKEASTKFSVGDLSRDARSLYSEFFLNNSSLFDDTLHVLEELKKRNIRLVAISDADKEVLYKELEMFDLLKFFNNVMISSEMKSYKPSDDTVKKLLKLCEKPLSGILFVGNGVSDMETARKMGVKSVLINRSSKHTQLKSNYVISSMKEITDIL